MAYGCLACQRRPTPPFKKTPGEMAREGRQVVQAVLIGPGHHLVIERVRQAACAGLRTHEKEIQMTAKELAILELLMSHPDKLFSRERILSNVWGLNQDPLTNLVDVYIGKLRKKIKEAGGGELIETVRGLGYRLI